MRNVFAMRVLVLGLILFVAVAACESESATPVGGATDPFAGRWLCSEEQSLTFTTPPNQPPLTSTETKTVTVTAASGQITAVSQSEGGAPGCPVSFTTTGNNAALVEGQSCQTSGVSLTYKSGSATVSGNTLTASLSYDAAGTLQMMSVTGTGTTTYSCSRISPPPSSGGSTTGGW